MKKAKAGFTLIELLVVVLIIGILAAVAVPQYQVAVTKSRYNTMKLITMDAMKAINLFYLQHGAAPNGFDDLDLEIPNLVDSKTAQFKNFTCTYSPTVYSLVHVNCKLHTPNGDITFRSHFYTDGSSRLLNVCITRKNNSLGNKICALETGKPGSTSVGGDEKIYNYYD